MAIRVGISGWRYAGWRGVFYPQGLPQRLELAYAAERMPSIEINGSFYALQRPEYYQSWYQETPADFVFSVKGPRFITHMKKLRDVATPLANFFASGVLCLEEKLGPILWQFPERLPFNDDRFERFFELLPRDTRAAVELSQRHDARLVGRSVTTTAARRKLRHAVEVRSLSCCSDRFVELLRQHDIALVVADTARRFPYLEDVTSDFVYVRLHGDEVLYTSGYSEQALTRWAERIRAWSSGSEPADAVRASASQAAGPERDVYVYFDNDAKVHAPFDALALSRMLGLDAERVPVQGARGVGAPGPREARAKAGPQPRAGRRPSTAGPSSAARSWGQPQARKRGTPAVSGGAQDANGEPRARTTGAKAAKRGESAL